MSTPARRVSLPGAVNRHDNPLLRMLPPPAPRAGVQAPRFTWAVVTGTAPLRIRIETDPDPLDATPSTIVGGINTGDRVFVLIANRRATVLGRANPSTSTGPQTLTAAEPFAGAANEGIRVIRSRDVVTLSLVATVSGDSPFGATIATLPAGYRPPFSLYPATYAGVANVGIRPAGAVVCYGTPAIGDTIRVTDTWVTSDPWPTA